MTVADFRNAHTFPKLVINPPTPPPRPQTRLVFLGPRRRPRVTASFLLPQRSPSGWRRMLCSGHRVLQLSSCDSKGLIMLKDAHGVSPPVWDIRNLLKRLLLAAVGSLSWEVKIPFSFLSWKGVLGFIFWWWGTGVHFQLYKLDTMRNST